MDNCPTRNLYEFAIELDDVFKSHDYKSRVERLAVTCLYLQDLSDIYCDGCSHEDLVILLTNKTDYLFNMKKDKDE